MTDQIVAASEAPTAALAPDIAAPIPSEDAERAELSRIFKGDDDTPEKQDAPEAANEAPEAKAEPEVPEEPLAAVIAAPSHLPEEIQALWKDIPEAARPALEKSYRSLGDRLAQQGRVVSAVKPSYDVLVRAAQEMPELAQMSPAQIAEGVFSLARREAQFVANPLEALIGLAQEHGQLDALRTALTGQQSAPSFDPRQFMGTLQQQLPALVKQQVAEEAQAQAAFNEVVAFSTSEGVKEFWPQVEEAVMDFIPRAVKKLGEGASPKDKLSLAYDMAIHADPDLRAKVRSASKKEPDPDPQKAADAARAASINVSSRGTGKTASMTERQMLKAAYDEAQRR